MDFGIGVPTGVDAWPTVQRAEALGFSHAWFYDTQMLCADPFVAMALAAVKTSRIRLGSLVSSVTFRHPGILAVQVAQVDEMSGGRVELGLGAGWMEQEHRAYGIPFPPKRFGMLEEQLAVVTGLWETPVDEEFSFEGSHYRLEESPALPKPVQERIPVVVGLPGSMDLVRHKHFGAAAASSGGTELYHIVGQTPEAPTLDAALRGRAPREGLRYGMAERRLSWELLNETGKSRDVDYVMLGCPHAAFEQIAEAAHLLDGRRIHANCSLWIFTSRAVKARADAAGLTEAIRAAGGQLMTDTCSAIGQAIPPGTRVVALDSAKQAHYLPAIMNIEAWFGTTSDCIDAALTGRWAGAPP